MLDKEMVQKIRAEMNDALKAVEEKYGLKIDIGTIRYSGNNFTAKLTALVIDEDSDSEDAVNAEWAVSFNRRCYALGFCKEDLGRPVHTPTGIGKLVGATVRSNHVIVQHGKKFFKINPVGISFAD